MKSSTPGANQRLAARHANFANPHADENACQAFVLVPREQVRRWHMRFRVRGAAIDAAEIAPVRYRDAQVGDLAAEFVSKPPFRSFCHLTKQKSPNPRLEFGLHTERIVRRTFPFPNTGGPGVSARTLSSADSRSIASRPWDFSPSGQEVGELNQSLLPSRRN